MKKIIIITAFIFLTGCGQQDLGQMVMEQKIDNSKLVSLKNANPIISAKYRVENTAFIKDAPDENSIKVEVGDKSSTEFKPEMSISRWEDEVSMKIGVPDKTKLVDSRGRLGASVSELTTDGEKIEYVEPDIEYHYYDIAPNEEHPEGAFEYEVVLKEKPLTNVVEMTIETTGLDFFYQPELTQEEKDEGAERPENVIGSYAVYHSTKSNYKIGDKNYKTGKAFHIYRPKIIDANGDWTWGELNIDNGILSVTIPEKWLDGAVYPVVVDPTFGYTSAGGSDLQVGYSEAPCDGPYSYPSAFSYDLSTAGTLDSLHGYYKQETSGDSTTFKTFLYTKDSNGSNSHDLIASAESDSKVNSTSYSWYTHTASDESLIADEYLLGVVPKVSEWATTGCTFRSAYVAYDTTGGESTYAGYDYYALPDPWNQSSYGTGQTFSIYATYTASAAPAAPTPNTSQIIWFD